MAVEGDVIIFIFTGQEERNEDGYYIIPQNATHLIVHESVTVIPARLFYKHPNIVEVYCHAGVKRIELMAFYNCPRFRRLIIPGVVIVGEAAFFHSEAVTYVECDNLEIIEVPAFAECRALGNMDLPSAKVVVEENAFSRCTALTDVKFGKNLETIRGGAFWDCPNLERITIPLKNGLFNDDDIFKGCRKLKHVDLVEDAILHETVDALLLEEWRNDMNAAIDSINQILPNAAPGYYSFYGNYDGEKTRVIRRWIERVLNKIIHYKTQHRLLLNEAASTLQLALPNDIVMNYIVPLLELPPHTFEGEYNEEEEEESDNGYNSSDGSN